MCGRGEIRTGFDGINEGKRLPGRPRNTRDNNIEMDLIKEDGKA
jgi:hypothetical protein